MRIFSHRFFSSSAWNSSSQWHCYHIICLVRTTTFFSLHNFFSSPILNPYWLEIFLFFIVSFVYFLLNNVDSRYRRRGQNGGRLFTEEGKKYAKSSKWAPRERFARIIKKKKRKKVSSMSRTLWGIRQIWAFYSNWMSFIKIMRRVLFGYYYYCMMMCTLYILQKKEENA